MGGARTPVWALGAGAVRCGEATGHSQVEATQPRPSQTRAKPPLTSLTIAACCTVYSDLSHPPLRPLCSADLVPLLHDLASRSVRDAHCTPTAQTGLVEPIVWGSVSCAVVLQHDGTSLGQVQHGAAARSTGVVATVHPHAAMGSPSQQPPAPLAQRPPDAADLVAKALRIRSITAKYTVYGPGQQASNGSIPNMAPGWADDVRWRDKAVEIAIRGGRSSSSSTSSIRQGHDCRNISNKPSSAVTCTAPETHVAPSCLRQPKHFCDRHLGLPKRDDRAAVGVTQQTPQILNAPLLSCRERGPFGSANRRQSKVVCNTTHLPRLQDKCDLTSLFSSASAPWSTHHTHTIQECRDQRVVVAARRRLLSAPDLHGTACPTGTVGA